MQKEVRLEISREKRGVPKTIAAVSAIDSPDARKKRGDTGGGEEENERKQRRKQEESDWRSNHYDSDWEY